MFSGEVGRYKYYELKDMFKSAGCQLCRTHVSWHNGLFEDDPIDQHEKCISCPVFYAIKLTKLYAQKLSEYERFYEDDGK